MKKMLSCRIRSIFIFLLIGGFAAAAAAQNRERLVEALDIQGNRRLTDQEILTHIKTRPGDLFDEKQVKEDFETLRALGLFNPKNTRLLIEEGSREGVHVIFEVQELPLIAEVDFGCLRFVSKEELIGELRAQNVKIESGMVYNLENFRNARRGIREFLEKRGLTEAKVEFYEEEISATAVKIKFHIKEMVNDDGDCGCCEN